ncbi:MAG: hypothetical protein HYY44_06110 [Deltaproteobacteria bacterium]|nr:hypothetical protein [Deltaproteobacteria bacterium]
MRLAWKLGIAGAAAAFGVGCAHKGAPHRLLQSADKGQQSGEPGTPGRGYGVSFYCDAYSHADGLFCNWRAKVFSRVVNSFRIKEEKTGAGPEEHLVCKPLENSRGLQTMYGGSLSAADGVRYEVACTPPGRPRTVSPIFMEGLVERLRDRFSLDGATSRHGRLEDLSPDELINQNNEFCYLTVSDINLRSALLLTCEKASLDRCLDGYGCGQE